MGTVYTAKYFCSGVLAFFEQSKMSVAEALSVQQSLIPIKPKAAPSILHSAKAAAKIPLAEQAALAVNSLTLLATVDPIIPSYVHKLLLVVPKPRETLSQNEQNLVSTAIIEVAAHLAPIFPIRHAQRVYEWLVNGLYAGLLGPSEEVDALLLSALPYHETSLFVPFVNAVVLPRPRSRWKWLLPVAQTRKPPSLSFMIKYCPVNVHRRAIEWVLKLASEGIPTTQASAFLVNVTARWIANAAPSDRRSVLLLCMKSVVTAVSYPISDSSHLLCALLLISTGGVIAGVDYGVASAIAAAASVLITTDSEAVSHTAVACLFMVVSQFGLSCVPSESVLNLLRKGKADVLFHVANLTNVGSHLYFEILLHALGNDLPSVELMNIFTDALTGNENITNDFISNAVTRVLELFSVNLKKRTGPSELSNEVELCEALERFLASFACGRFAEAVDVGLRNYFDKREKMKSRRFDIVDKALGSALSGTFHQIIKMKSGEESDQTDSVTLLSALEHPEHSVRQHGLNYIMAKSNQNNQQLGEVLKSKLLDVFDAEVNPKVILTASDCLLKFSDMYDYEFLLRRSSAKLLDILGMPPRTKGKSTELAQLAQTKLLSFCELAVKKAKYDVLSLLVGIILHDMFIEDPTATERAQSLMQECVTVDENVDFIGEKKFKKGVEKGICLLVLNPSFEHLCFLKKLIGWNRSWGFRIIMLWCEVFDIEQSNINVLKVFEAIISALEEMYVAGDEKRFLKSIRLVCQGVLSVLPVGDREKCGLKIWRLSSSKNATMLKDAVLSLSSSLGVECTTNVIKTGFCTFETEALRAASFQWYINLASFQSEDSKKMAMMSLIIIWFGDNTLLRDEAEKFIKVYISEESSSRSSGDLEKLCRLLSNRPVLRYKSSALETSSDLIASQLDEHIIAAFIQKNNLPLSFPVSSSNTGERDDMIAVVLNSLHSGMSLLDALPLLRAVHHCNLDINQPTNWMKSLWVFLQRGLVEVPADGLDYHYEVVARIISLLSSASISTLTPKEVFSLLESIILRMENGLHLQNVDNRLNLLFVSAGLLLFRMMNRTIHKVLDLQVRYVRILLIYSARSSVLGTVSQKIMDATVGDFFPLLALKNPLAQLNLRKLQSLKKTHALPDEDVMVFERAFSEFDVATNEIVGVLDSIRRWCKRQPEGSTHPTMLLNQFSEAVWKFLAEVSELKGRENLLDGALEFILRLSLDSLRDLYDLVKNDLLEDAVMFDVVISLMIYHGENSETDESAMAKSVRKSALDLVEVLAPLYGKKLFTRASVVIDALLEGNVSTKSLKSLHILIPCLIKGGENFEMVSKWLAKASFKPSRSVSELSSLRKIIASCCQYTSNVYKATVICMNDMIELLEAFLSCEEVGQQCALLLRDSGLSIIDDVGVISLCSEKVRPHFASFYLMDSAFVSKLFASMHTMEDSEVEIVMNAYSNMLKSLARGVIDSVEEKAITTSLSILPLPGLAICMDRACSDVDSSSAIILLSFASLLEDNFYPMLPDWNLESTVSDDGGFAQAKKTLFFDHMACSLSNALTTARNNEKFCLELIKPALCASEMLLKRLGAEHISKSLELATAVVELVEEDLIKLRQSSECTAETKMLLSSLSAGLGCLSTTVRILRKKSIPVIPRMLKASIELIEIAFTRNELKRKKNSKWASRIVSATEAAINVSVSVLERVPEMFGEKDLYRMISLVLKNEVQVIRDLLDLAVRELPCSTVTISMVTAAGRLEEIDASANGIGMVITSLQNGLDTMKKSQIKLQAKSFLEVCCKSLEYSKNMLEKELYGEVHNKAKGFIGNEQKGWVSDNFGYVSGKCGDFVTSLTLRLPESEFKKIFDNFAQWCEAESLFKRASAVCHKHDLQLQKTLLRAVPFYETVVKLFGKLGPIMIPYLMQHLNKVLSVLCTKKWSVGGSGNSTPKKKRNLTRLEIDEELSVCSALAKMHENLRIACLESVTLMLNQSSSTAFLTSEIVVRIQDSLLTCFDEFSGKNRRISLALSALSVRISGMRNADESREESRELLKSLSRQLLVRTRENAVSMREGALAASKAMAEAVGDEYLVTLPETMPILAEVIDDEHTNVRKGALAFASVLEAMAGEPIVDQLK